MATGPMHALWGSMSNWLVVTYQTQHADVISPEAPVTLSKVGLVTAFNFGNLFTVGLSISGHFEALRHLRAKCNELINGPNKAPGATECVEQALDAGTCKKLLLHIGCLGKVASEGVSRVEFGAACEKRLNVWQRGLYEVGWKKR